MASNKLKYQIEALLFFYNEPITIKKIASLTTKNPEKIKSTIEELINEYENRGLRIVLSQQEVQLVAHIEDEELIQKLDTAKQESTFTPAVMETLSVVAYLEGLSDVQVDKIRGVKSARTIKKLIRRGYIDRIDDKLWLSAEAKKQLGILGDDSLADKDVIKMKLSDLVEQSDD
jgi:segregation and condensation protein B